MDAASVEQRLAALESLEAIRALKARYLFCCDRKDPAGMRACFADGKVHIDYGIVGTFDNADALVNIYTGIACHPHMVEMHHGANPQIEVVDAEHARGKWSLHYCLIDTKTKSFTQLAGYYEDEYCKTGAGWKITSTRFIATSTLAMDLSEGAAKVLFAGNPMLAA
jgi:hypothetical protein